MVKPAAGCDDDDVVAGDDDGGGGDGCGGGVGVGVGGGGDDAIHKSTVVPILNQCMGNDDLNSSCFVNTAASVGCRRQGMTNVLVNVVITSLMT